MRAIKVMMAYSKGDDTTNFHILYWKDCLFSGMYRVSGLALMAKSIQALCGEENATTDWVEIFSGWRFLKSKSVAGTAN